MKSAKIIKYLQEILDHNTAGKKAALKKLLAKLKKKCRKLESKLAEANTAEERAALEEKLKVNLAHRKKGLKALRKLNGKE